MCQAIPCPGCQICFAELSALARGNFSRTGPLVDRETPEFGWYVVKNSGCNQDGNYYESRQFGNSYPNRNSYHYQNQDGSRYWSNPDGSTLYRLAPASPALPDMKPSTGKMDGKFTVRIKNEADSENGEVGDYPNPAWWKCLCLCFRP